MSRRKIKSKTHVKRVRKGRVMQESRLSALDVRRRRKKNLEERVHQKKARKRMQTMGIDSITLESIGDKFSLDTSEKEIPHPVEVWEDSTRGVVQRDTEE